MSPLSDQAFLALVALDNGAKMNCVHTTSRELIAAGLACEDWGRLGITEAGRLRVRSMNISGRRMTIDDDNVADMWVTPAVSHRIDPLEAFNLAEAEVAHAIPPPARCEPIGAHTVPPPPPIEPAADDHTRALRAAGVATGLTGIEVEPRWVREFIIAFVNAA